MREAVVIGRRAAAAATVASALMMLAAGCDLVGLVDSEGLLDVSLPGSEPESGQEVVFEGQVVAVDLESSVLKLADGAEVAVEDSSALRDEFGVTSLEAAKHALEGDRDLIAWGSGVVESVEPLVIEAGEVTLKPAERLEFEGHVESVDVEAGTVSFEDGRTIRVTRGTEISDDFHIASLEAAAGALEEGEELVAWGDGWERSEEPQELLAREITFKVRVPEPVEFEGEVTAINLDAGTVTLASGTVIHVTGETQIVAEHEIASLAAAKEQLDAGEDLIAWGVGPVEHEEPRTIQATKLTFKVRVAEFEGQLSSVFAELDGFKLSNGTIVRVNAETTYSAEFDLPSLEAAKAALENGHDVAAWGNGRLEAEEPRTVTAKEVVFKVVE